MGSSEFTKHDADHGDENPAGGTGFGLFVVAHRSAVSHLPAEGAFDHPAFWQHLETAHVVGSGVAAIQLGEVIRNLGGGRLTKESVINPDVGLDQIAKPGEAVKSGHPLVRIHAANRAQAKTAKVGLKGVFEISVHPPRLASLVAEVVVPK